MHKRAGFLLALVLSGCLGQPEDIFLVTGSVAGAATMSDDTRLVLWHDEGHTEAGCSTFTKFKSFNIKRDPTFKLRVLRAEAENAAHEPRCLKLEIIDGSHFIEAIWIFSDQDVLLPPLSWEKLPSILAYDGNVWLNRLATAELPEGIGEPTYFFELSSELMRWRQITDTIFVDLPIPTWEGTGPWEARGYAKFTGSSFVYDPFGQLKEHRFELRLGHTAAIDEGPQAHMKLLSQDQPCDLPAEPCPLTDGTSQPVQLPAGTEAVTLTLPPYYTFNYVYLRGLWAGDNLDSVKIDVSRGIGFDFVPFGSRRVNSLLPVSRKLDERLPSIDIGPFYRSGIHDNQLLRIRGVDAQNQTVPLVSLGEVSVY